MPVLPNAKHERFAQAIAKGKSASEAYVLAGYAENDSNAARLNGNERIRNRIEEILSRAAEKVAIDKAKVLEELAKIGFSNMLDYIQIGDDGLPIADFSKLTRDQAAAISEVIVETRTERQGEETVPIRKVRFKLADKRGALVDIGRELGMFVERRDVRVTQQASDLTDAELEALITGRSRDGASETAPGSRKSNPVH